MQKFLLAALTATSLLATTAFSQENEVNCEDEANKDDPACLALPPAQEATNFAPGLLAPALGGAAAAAALAGGGGGSPTTATTNTTTSTTSTTN